MFMLHNVMKSPDFNEEGGQCPRTLCYWLTGLPGSGTTSAAKWICPSTEAAAQIEILELDSFADRSYRGLPLVETSEFFGNLFRTINCGRIPFVVGTVSNAAHIAEMMGAMRIRVRFIHLLPPSDYIGRLFSRQCLWDQDSEAWRFYDRLIHALDNRRLKREDEWGQLTYREVYSTYYHCALLQSYLGGLASPMEISEVLRDDGITSWLEELGSRPLPARSMVKWIASLRTMHMYLLQCRFDTSEGNERASKQFSLPENFSDISLESDGPFILRPTAPSSTLENDDQLRTNNHGVNGYESLQAAASVAYRQRPVFCFRGSDIVEEYHKAMGFALGSALDSEEGRLLINEFFYS